MKKNLLGLSIGLLSLSAVAQTPRLSLYEEFTGENCGPCAQTNPALNVLLASPTTTPKMVAIKWQVPIPSAPSATWSLYKTDKAEIDWRAGAAPGGYGYSPPINSAPSSKIDGQEATVFGAASGHPGYLNSTVISTAQSYTSAFSITMTRAWDAIGSAVILTVNIQATAPFTAVGPLVFRTVMVEEHIAFATSPGSNGEKDFDDVVIKSFPSIQNGIPMASSWTVGQTQTFTLNCPIPAYTREKEQVAFVGFIQDDGNRKVAQAARAGKATLTNDAKAAGAKVPVTCAASINPEITVYNNGTSAITNLTITPSSDGVAGAVTIWSGNLAAGASTTILLNSIAAGTTPGPHLFSYNLTAMNGTDFNLNNNIGKVSYVVASGYQTTPVAEGFVMGAYPPVGFTVVNPDAGLGWSRSTQAGAYNIGTLQSTKYDFFNNPVVGDKDELFLPPMDLSGSLDPMMFFDIAYAQRSALSNDALDVLASDDCGATWTNVFSQQGAALTQIPAVNTAYVPNSSDPTEWRTELFYLPGFNKANVLVKFVATNGGNGNNLYLDNINLIQSEPSTVGLSKIDASAMSIGLYPNPTQGITNVKINSVKASGANISVSNMLGQVVLTKQVSLAEGANTVPLDLKEQAAGIYNVVITTGNGSVIKKLNLTK